MTTPYRDQAPTVYVIQEDAKKNMTSALNYGSMELLLEEREEANMLNIPRITARIKHGLRNFKPGDYLLLIGSPVSIGIAFAIAADMTDGQFNILKWDQQERMYWKAAVNLKQGE